MRAWKRLIAVGATSLAVASSGLAQTTNSSGSSVTSVSPSGTVSTSGNTGGNGGGSSTPQSSGATLNTTTLATVQVPKITPPSQTQNASSNQAIDVSNVFQYYYGSVYWQGRNGASVNQAPGGLGTTLYTTTGGTGAAGARGGRGGATGLSGGSGSIVTKQTGEIVQLPRTISFVAQARFPVQPVMATQLQTDLRGVIDRTPTSMLTNPAAVQVVVDGNNVVLKGSVRDIDESRMVEGLVRLTPGVRQIRNELAVATP